LIGWRKIIQRCLLLACFASAPAISTEGQGASSLQSPVSARDSCTKDYPIPTTSVNYEHAFASETLIPDQISMNGEIFRPGASEERLSRAIGAKSNIVENAVQRSETQQCGYLLELLRDHPNSMYLYRIRRIQLQHMSGVFRVAEWQVPGIGKLRAFLCSPSKNAAEVSYLFLLTLNPTSMRDVKRHPGADYVLIRSGAGRINWNVDANSITMSTSSEAR
jgi:hypothetical protein